VPPSELEEDIRQAEFEAELLEMDPGQFGHYRAPPSSRRSHTINPPVQNAHAVTDGAEHAAHSGANT